MAHDYEDIHNIETLDDRELRDLVREQLETHGALDIDDITVSVTAGMVTLSGRVGTEGERRVAEHVLTDVLGVQDFTNDLVIDPIARAVSPEAIDEHLVDEEARSGTLLGDATVPFSPESDDLVGERMGDLAGTADYENMMENGMTYNLPDSPTPEGMRGSDAGPEEMDGRH